MIDAATACLAEKGAAGATMASISARSGVSWGGIQHHFPTKDDIHQAVVDDVLDQLRAEVSAAHDPEASLESRVTEVVRAWWRMFRRPPFRAYLEVVLAARGPTGPRYLVPHAQAILEALWNDVFGDLELTDDQRNTGLRLLFAAMAGLVVDVLMIPEVPGRGLVLERVAGSLVGILSGEPQSIGNFTALDD